MEEIFFRDLGLIHYKSAWDIQENLLKENLEAKAIRKAHVSEGEPPESHIKIPSTKHHLLFCEHHPVYTLGKSGHQENILISDDDLTAQGIEYFKTNRGGDITFHGLQQVVGYPIIDLEKFYTDIGKYLRSLEQVIILTLADYGIKGARSSGETGVWIEPGVPGRERKICAMGVRCSRWITMHGWALNVNTDLSYFDNIIPCGIKGKEVTSMKKELGHEVNFEEVKENLKEKFAIVFNSILKPSLLNRTS